MSQDTIYIIGTVLAVGVALWRLTEARYLALNTRMDAVAASKANRIDALYNALFNQRQK